MLSAIIPATQLFFTTLIFTYVFITDGDLLEPENFIIFLSFIFGICGYIGLLLTLKGLHKTNHLKKFTLIGLGVFGFITLNLITNNKGF